MLYAVIMAGGSGTRLWPLSRKSQPKQSLKLIGDCTMFQHAVDRLSPLFTPDRIFVVTNANMAAVLMPQAPEAAGGKFHPGAVGARVRTGCGAGGDSPVAA